jgi:broad-specificity NMP kinase
MSQQTHELTAPPRDPTEVLIEEVRHQTRRRRWRNLALALLALVAGATIYLVTSGGNRAPTPSDARSTPVTPSAVASAIKRTLSVQSVEVLMSYEAEPGIYQAPNLYSFWERGGKATVVASFIAGKTEYRTNQGIARSPGVTNHVYLLRAETASPSKEKNGLSPAQQAAFGPLIDYLGVATEFVRTGPNTYSFHLDLTSGGGNQRVRLTGGDVTLARGYVTNVRIDSLTTINRTLDGKTPTGTFPGSFAVSYERIDDNPRLVAPRPHVSMCLPAGSLIPAEQLETAARDETGQRFLLSLGTAPDHRNGLANIGQDRVVTTPGGYVIQLLGYPGVGKYTIALELTEELGIQGETARLVDNHRTTNLITELLAEPYVHGMLDVEARARINEIRSVVARTIAEQSPREWTFVFTNFPLKNDPLHTAIFHNRELAERRGTPFLPIVLTCDVDELLRRVQSPGREARQKLRDPRIAAEFIDRGLLVPDWPELQEVDVTSLTPKEAAQEILRLRSSAD